MCRLLFGEGVVKRPEAPCHYQFLPHPDHSKGWGQSSLGARKNSWGWGESSLSRRLLLAFKFPNNTTLAIRITGLLVGHHLPSGKLVFLSVTKGYLITQRLLYNPMSLKWRTYTMYLCFFYTFIHDKTLTCLGFCAPFLTSHMQSSFGTTCVHLLPTSRTEPLQQTPDWPPVSLRYPCKDQRVGARGQHCEPDLLHDPRAPFCALRCVMWPLGSSVTSSINRR